MFPKARLKRLLPLLLAPLALILSGCQTEIALTVNKDDTYMLSARMVRSAPASDKNACADVKKVVEAAKDAAAAIEVTQTAQDKLAVCEVKFRTPQPINDTRAPFVKIRRSGDYFTATLAPDTTKTLAFSPDDQLRMEITFPGVVTSVDSKASAKYVAKTVTWTSPEALSAGFTVVARSADGLTSWQSFWLFIAVILLVFLLFTLAVIAARNTKLGGRLWQWERSWLVPLSAIIVGWALNILDWLWRQYRRARLAWRRLRAQRIARVQGSEAITSQIPIVTKKPAKKTEGPSQADRMAASVKRGIRDLRKFSDTHRPVQTPIIRGQAVKSSPASDTGLFFSEPRAQQEGARGLYFVEPRAEKADES